ncbi:hypothetical protein M422DRAFT_238135 [Sphaerobolus stellatus SS14]|nr:hypothetical protein M422DRAFT_238135 [Sphaerobolus stellatus SS14]
MYRRSALLRPLKSLSSYRVSQAGVRFISSKPNTSYLEPTHSTATVPPAQEEIINLAEKYILPVYARPKDIVISHGDGSYMYSLAGNKYLDFSAGIAVNALGHGDKAFLEELNRLAGEIIHASNVYQNKWVYLCYVYAARLGELLVELTKKEGGLGFAPGSTGTVDGSGAKVFFSNTGTEANEGALKIARMAGKHLWAQKTGQAWDAPDAACSKTRIVCFKHGFHGRSMGALSVTTNAKYQAPFEPLLPGVDVGSVNEVEGLERLITDDTCAVIIEPIQGEGGVHESHVDWLRALKKRCDETGAVLIFDEIQCGLYRTGDLWAHSSYPVDCHPDIVTMAKPLANGYPIGAVVMRDRIAQYMTAGTHGTTFGGSPLACGLGLHVLTRLSSAAFVKDVHETGTYLNERLQQLPGWFPSVVKEIRGRGLIRGIGMRDGAAAGALVSLARERGVLLLTAGSDAVRLVPSLNVGRTEVDLALDVIESCMHKL